MFNSEIKFQPEKGRCYVGSPSAVRWIDGSLVATHDYFGRGAPKLSDGMEGLTSVYRSEDNGTSWINITHIMEMYWCNLFCHQNSLWLLGCSREYGSIVIRQSRDGGYSWSNPVDTETGLLFAGGSGKQNPNYHGATQVCFHQGRIYRAFEDCLDTLWPQGFQALVISAPENSDLLSASSWTMSNKIQFNSDWLKGNYEKTPSGWLEGSVVADPQGNLFNILRLAMPLQVWQGHEPSSADRDFNLQRMRNCGGAGLAAMVRILDAGARLEFNPATGFLPFPGGNRAKFTIRRDAVSGLYFSLVNARPDPEPLCNRDVLSLSVSDDLYHWRVIKKLLQDESGLDDESSCRLTGFQYPDWNFDGKDLIFAVRTSYRGAHTFHDSNRITFHRLTDFRQLL